MSSHGGPVDQPEDWGSVERFEPGQGHGAVTRLAAVAALGGFLFGYDSAVINGAVTAIGDQFDTAAAACWASWFPPRCSARRSAPGRPAAWPTGSGG